MSATELATEAIAHTAPLRNENPMKLGAFAMNCSGGMTLTKFASNRIIPTWDQQVRIAWAADEAGWDGIDGLGLGWLEYESGIARFNKQVLPLMISAGLRKP